MLTRSMIRDHKKTVPEGSSDTVAWTERFSEVAKAIVSRCAALAIFALTTAPGGALRVCARDRDRRLKPGRHW